MKNLKAKAVCVMLSASMAAMGLTGCGSDNVDGTKTAITVNDESITLGQANFMLRYQQATMYNYYSKMYSMYGMQMPSEMYDKEGDDGKTTGETFKEQSLDTIEKELLMRQHAEEYGISLTDEEKQQAKEVRRNIPKPITHNGPKSWPIYKAVIRNINRSPSKTDQQPFLPLPMEIQEEATVIPLTRLPARSLKFNYTRTSLNPPK